MKIISLKQCNEKQVNGIKFTKIADITKINYVINLNQ